MNEKDMILSGEENAENLSTDSDGTSLEDNIEAQIASDVVNDISQTDGESLNIDIEVDENNRAADDGIVPDEGSVDTCDPVDSSENTDDAEPIDCSVENSEEKEEKEEEDIAYVAERITGVRHSEVTTAAPIRTRTPEQNRNITNGIPMRERKSDASSITAETESEPRFKFHSPFVITVSAAVIAIILMISAVLIINSMYVDSTDSGRAHDFNMANKIDPDSLIHIESKVPDHTITDVGSETDGDIGTTDESSSPSVEPGRQKYSVTLDFFEGEDITVATEKITFAGLLEEIGYTLKNTDRPSVENDFVIAADTVIKIDKVQYVNVTVTEDIEYEVERIETDLIMRGTTNYITQGEPGMKEVLYSVEYVNGVEVSRTFISEQITKAPVNETYEYGVGGSFVGADGVTYTYSMRRIVPATYYNIEGPTYLGFDADETVIAVDPSYIPLGTVLYVKNEKFDFGKRTAADTGSLIRGWEVDIWIADDNPQLADFARIGYHYDMEIYYIDQ